MTVTVRLAGENHQPFSALWRFEQGQVYSSMDHPMTITIEQRKDDRQVRITRPSFASHTTDRLSSVSDDASPLHPAPFSCAHHRLAPLRRFGVARP